VALALFTVWSMLFIAETVVTTYDGRRVFCLFDDAMVSMRYAWNLAHGNGLVWNPGERVEGYTNLGHTLSMAVFILLLGKFNAVAAVQVMGVVAVAVSAVLGMRIAERLSRENGIEVTALWQGIYLAVSLAYYPLSYWSLMGMETGPLAALLAGAALAGLRAPEDRVSWPLVVLSATAFLVRPDALVTVAVIFLFRLAALPRNRRALPVFLAEVGTVGGVVVAASMFRWLYYGSWVPNTYTLKVSGYSLGFRIENGWSFVVPFLKTAAVPLAIALAGLLLRPKRSTGLLVAIFGAAVAYQVWVGGDAWDYWRFFAPSVPLLVLSSIVQLRAALRNRGPVPPGQWSVATRLRENTVVLAVLVITLWNLNAAFLPEMLLRALPYDVSFNQRAVNVGLALEQVTTGSATVGVFRAGAIPYFSERRGVDFLGKSDPYIARLAPDLSGASGRFGMRATPGHSKYDLNYSILHLRPTYVERVQRGRQDTEPMASQLYTRAFYRAVRLNLLMRSRDVLWGKLDDPSRVP
jgi:hypothetical protein